MYDQVRSTNGVLQYQAQIHLRRLRQLHSSYASYCSYSSYAGACQKLSARSFLAPWTLDKHREGGDLRQRNDD